MSKIEKWDVQIVKECIVCENCNQEMIALENTHYTYICPVCNTYEDSKIKYPRIIIE